MSLQLIIYELNQGQWEETMGLLNRRQQVESTPEYNDNVLELIEMFFNEKIEECLMMGVNYLIAENKRNLDILRGDNFVRIIESSLSGSCEEKIKGAVMNIFWIKVEEYKGNIAEAIEHTFNCLYLIDICKDISRENSAKLSPEDDRILAKSVEIAMDEFRRCL